MRNAWSSSDGDRFENEKLDGRPLRIAQVAPLYESVPPKGYGGTERVVSYLTEELVRVGHDVTLFASGDSVTAAKLVAPCAKSLRLLPQCVDQLAPHLLMLEMVFKQASEFDVIHFHVDYLHYSLSRRHAIRHLTTLHGRLDIPELKPLYREFCEVPLVSISDAQRMPLSHCRWLGTVYHGLPPDLHRFRESAGDYLAFLGRVSPEKGLEHAIEIARRIGMPLKVSAKVDKTDLAYFERRIRPLLTECSSFVEWVGETGGKEKDEFLGNAYAMLFPVNWPEPFGLVMIEAMACGTPVIAYRCGSVPEVMEHGVTGYIVDGMAEAVRAVRHVGELSRKACREAFDRRFTAARMARDYIAIYRRLMHVEKTAGRQQLDGVPIPTQDGAPSRGSRLPEPMLG